MVRPEQTADMVATVTEVLVDLEVDSAVMELTEQETVRLASRIFISVQQRIISRAGTMRKR